MMGPLPMSLLPSSDAVPLLLLATCARAVDAFVPAAIGPVGRGSKTGLPLTLLPPLPDAAPQLLLAARVAGVARTRRWGCRWRRRRPRPDATLLPLPAVRATVVERCLLQMPLLPLYAAALLPLLAA
jgi:hypothetical protein